LIGGIFNYWKIHPGFSGSAHIIPPATAQSMQTGNHALGNEEQSSGAIS
jgi:hypothetical protein